jgi:hypothetical protein
MTAEEFSRYRATLGGITGENEALIAQELAKLGVSREK